jgi:hypothetical protein
MIMRVAEARKSLTLVCNSGLHIFIFVGLEAMLQNSVNGLYECLTSRVLPVPYLFLCRPNLVSLFLDPGPIV